MAALSILLCNEVSYLLIPLLSSDDMVNEKVRYMLYYGGKKKRSSNGKEAFSQ